MIIPGNGFERRKQYIFHFWKDVELLQGELKITKTADIWKKYWNLNGLYGCLR